MIAQGPPDWAQAAAASSAELPQQLSKTVVFLVVAVLCSGEIDEELCVDSDTAYGINEVFGAKPEDIAWVTPVLEEHFTYHSSVLAGRPWIMEHDGQGHHDPGGSTYCEQYICGPHNCFESSWTM